MKRLEMITREPRGLALLVVLPLLLVMIIANFQPFFTGDEFIPFGAQLESPGFFHGFAKMNEYKPRLMHHGILSALVSVSAPRWVWAALVYIVLAAIAYLIIDIVGKLYRGSHRLLVLFLSAFAFFSSRYALVAYHEYANSLIDIVALFFFLLGMRVFVVKRLLAGIGSFFVIAIMFVLAGLNHERYAIIGSAIIGVWALFCMVRNGFLYGLPRIAIALIPVGLIIALTLLVSKSGLTMGTGGQTVSMSGHVVINAMKYVSNIFLGTGFGPELFWGKLQGIGLVLSVFGTIVAIIMVFLGWLSRKGIQSKDCFAWVLIAGVFVAIGVMSLPAIERMEMRWVTVVFVMLLFIFVMLSGKRALPVLSFLVIANFAFHATAYRNNEILVVMAPKSAERFGGLLKVFDFNSISLKVRANLDAGWLFLGSNPDQYMMANRKSVN
ncbi:MAG TPA: hypothetical protein PK297_14365, partial [Spirochaetota bacterium]|nr:hypothetical protein [Spirochaetota bacterium]